MVQSLHAGDNMEFFIEGSRSRSGKPGMPKAGLLSVLVDSVKEGMPWLIFRGLPTLSPCSRPAGVYWVIIYCLVSYVTGIVEDILIVPVSISYDKVPVVLHLTGMAERVRDNVHILHVTCVTISHVYSCWKEHLCSMN